MPKFLLCSVLESMRSSPQLSPLWCTYSMCWLHPMSTLAYLFMVIITSWCTCTRWFYGIVMVRSVTSATSSYATPSWTSCPQHDYTHRNHLCSPLVRQSLKSWPIKTFPLFPFSDLGALPTNSYMTACIAST